MTRISAEILDDLHAHADLWDPYQLLRVLQAEFPDVERVGTTTRPQKEPLRFETLLTHAFAGSAIHHVERREGSLPPLRVIVTFMGLYGPQSTLPRCYTELLMSRALAGDHGLRAFLDMVNHRSISLFVRANEKYRAHASTRVAGDDAVSQLIASLMGLTLNVRRDESGLVPRRHLLRYAGLWTQVPRSLAALEALLADYFPDHLVRVEQFVGRWVYLPEDAWGRVSARATTNQIGENVVVGSRVYDRAGHFRLRVGPLSLSDYLSFQPGGDNLATMASLVREFIGDHLWFDVQPVLRAEEIPELHLARGASPAPRLGRTTWLVSKPRSADGDEPTFHAAA